MARQHYQDVIIMDAKATTGVGNYIYVGDYRNLIVSIATASSANLTVKCAGAIAADCPDMASAQSVSNMYDFIQMIDLQNGDATDGDTGFVVTGTDDFRLFEINTNGFQWLTFRVTARSAGSVTIKMMETDNL